MVRACGGIEGNQIGEDARLCMGGKVRGKCAGSFESVSSHGDIQEASHLDRLHRSSLSASETHLDSFLKVPPFLGYGLAPVYLFSTDWGSQIFGLIYELAIACCLDAFLLSRRMYGLIYEV